MASEEVLDVESLVQPVSEEKPSGADIRLDSSPTSLYFTIKQARNTARAAERNSLFDDESASEVLDKWRPVLDIAPKILISQGKDLEVVSWYIEALIRFHGFAGLRDGFRLAKELISRYWDGLYPEPDEDGLETKVAPITGLNGEGGEGTLLAPIRNTLITDSGSAGAFSFWQYQQAGDIEKLADPEQRQQRSATLGFDLNSIRGVVAETNAAFYVDLRDDLEAAIAHFREFNQLLDEHCGSDAPPSSNIRNLLEDVLASVKHLAKDKLAASEKVQAATETPDRVATSTGSASSSVAAAATGSAPLYAGTAMRNRDDALRRLHEIADFFRKSEPHSPMADAIDRVVRWGYMPLHELLSELLPDKTAQATYAQLTGVRFEGNIAFVPPAPQYQQEHKQQEEEEEEDDRPSW